MNKDIDRRVIKDRRISEVILSQKQIDAIFHFSEMEAKIALLLIASKVDVNYVLEIMK